MDILNKFLFRCILAQCARQLDQSVAMRSTHPSAKKLHCWCLRIMASCQFTTMLQFFKADANSVFTHSDKSARLILSIDKVVGVHDAHYVLELLRPVFSWGTVPVQVETSVSQNSEQM